MRYRPSRLTDYTGGSRYPRMRVDLPPRVLSGLLSSTYPARSFKTLSSSCSPRLLLCRLRIHRLLVPHSMCGLFAIGSSQHPKAASGSRSSPGRPSSPASLSSSASETASAQRQRVVESSSRRASSGLAGGGGSGSLSPGTSFSHVRGCCSGGCSLSVAIARCPPTPSGGGGGGDRNCSCCGCSCGCCGCCSGGGGVGGGCCCGCGCCG